MSNVKPIVLVVEDEDVLLQAIAQKLELEGLSCVSCTSGEQARDFLKNTDTLPAAIWLDYHLKDMDGLSFLSEVKANDAWAKIPVVVVSNSASPNKVHSMLALGANKYLLKAEHRLGEIIKVIKDFVASGNHEEGSGS